MNICFEEESEVFFMGLGCFSGTFQPLLFSENRLHQLCDLCVLKVPLIFSKRPTGSLKIKCQQNVCRQDCLMYERMLIC